MNYLITGSSGFVAGHLIEHIFREDTGAKITGSDKTQPNYCFLDADLRQAIRFIKGGLSDIQEVIKTIEIAEPQFIIHLASSSSVAHSWQYPIDSFKNNSTIFLNLLEAVRHTDSKIRILSIGSSEQYGIVSPDKIPLTEKMSPNPVSPYAVARVAQEYMASVYVAGYKLDIVSTRSFNHVGPRQDSRFVLSSFAKQIAEIQKCKREPIIHVGDLSIIRDFSDVRDVSRAYLSLLTRGISGEVYNVCSGIGREIEDCLKMQLKIANVECKICVDEKLIRPADNPTIIGDNSKLYSGTGWFPKIPFEVTLLNLYEYWLRETG